MRLQVHYSETGDASVRSATCHALVLALTAALPHQSEVILPSDIDWPDMLALAQKTKTVGLLRKGLRNLNVKPPAPVAAQLDAFQSEVLRRNLANIARAVEITQILEASGIRSLVLKGPFRSEQVYGNLDVRSAADVDILVRRSEYRQSIDALCDLGYSCLVTLDDRWWHDFLGEAPFVNFSSPFPAVDLHNQLQQPGGPYPRNVDGFFEASQLRSVGSREVAVLSREHALILAAISFCKAVRSGDPWLPYAHELSYCIAASDESLLEQLRVCARSQDILRLFDHFVSWSAALFGREDLTAGEALPHNDDLVFSSCGQKELPAFGRTKAMWRWSEGDGLSRVQTFFSILARDFRSKQAYRHSTRPEFMLGT